MVRVIGLIIIALLLGANTVAAMVLTLKQEAIVSSKQFTLADLIEDPQQLPTILKKKPLGLSPRPGYTANIPVALLRAKVRKIYPQFQSVKWTGANNVLVKAQGRRFDGGRIEMVAEASLTQFLQQHFIDHKIELLDNMPAIVMPEGTYSFKAYLPDNASVSQRMGVWVDALVDNILHQTYRVWFRVSAQQMVYVAKRDLPKGMLISADLLDRRVIDVAASGQQPVYSEKSLHNKRIIANVAAGKVLPMTLLEEVPMVAKGEWVDVHIQSGGVAINTKAVALRNGAFKESIYVLNPATQSSYRAVVTGQDKVTVE